MMKWELIIECDDGERVKVFHARVLNDGEGDKVEPARRKAQELLGEKIGPDRLGFYRYWDGQKWIRTEGRYDCGDCVAVLENGAVLCAVKGYQNEVEQIA